MITTGNERRDLQTATTSASSTTVSRADAAALYALCPSDAVLERTWDGTQNDPIDLCPGKRRRYQSNKQIYYYTLSDGSSIDIDCSSDPCTVTGSGLLQEGGEYCAYNSDCKNNVCEKNACDCPVGEGFCTANYAPVLCNGCCYSNLCAAGLADASFTSSTCTSVATC